MPSLHQQRLTSMLDYVEEWDKLNRTPVFDIACMALMIWQQDVAELPGFSLNSSDESGERLADASSVRPTKPPQLPVELVPWIVVSDDPLREPHRRESILHPTGPGQEINFDDAPERETAFAAYTSINSGLSGPPLKSQNVGASPITIKLFNLTPPSKLKGRRRRWNWSGA